jgi:solute:Na+ symporter, SSS family
MHLALHAADYIVVVGYFVLVLWIGLWFRNRLTNMGDYFAGGHQVPWWMAGISHYMSSFSAFSFVAYAQMGYMYGWVAVTLFWVSVPACLAGGAIFARRWRRAQVITPVEFLEMRYDAVLRQIFALAGIPMKLFDDALKIFATALFVSVAAGLDLRWSICTCGLVMVGYTFFGGLWALVATDYVQFLMKSLAILLLLPLALNACGGMRAAFLGLPRGFLTPVNGPYGWLYVVGFACVMLVSYNASWSLAQKYYCVPDERAASKAAYLSAALNLVGAPLMVLPAIVGRHFLPDLAARGDTADAYLLIVVRLLPEGMVGIILAAMFSATMAAVSADFNAIASVLTQDMYHRLIRKDASDSALLRIGRWLTLALGAATTLLALLIALRHREALFSLMVTVLGLLMAPTLLPLLAGLTLRWVSARGALLGFLAGLGTGTIMLLLQDFWRSATILFGNANGFEGFSLIVITAMTLAGMAVGSLWNQGNEAERSRRATFLTRLECPVKQSERDQRDVSLINSVLAISTSGVGVLIALAGAISHAAGSRWIDGGAALIMFMIAWKLRRANSSRVDGNPGPSL